MTIEKIKLNTIDLPVNGNVSASLFTEKYRLDSLNLVSAQKSFEFRVPT